MRPLGGTAVPGKNFTASVVRSGRELEFLEGDWEELYAASSPATPFQSWAWLYSWWEVYGSGREPCIITVRSGGKLVGLLPLVREHWTGRVLFMGTGPSVYLDMLAREGAEEAVARAAAERLREELRPWEVADLQHLRPGAAAWELLRSWEGPAASVWQTDCPVLKARPFEELLAPLTQKQRGNVRRLIRRSEREGLRAVAAGAEEAAAAASRMLGMHRKVWRNRGINPEHLSPRFEALLRLASERLTKRGLGFVSEFRRGEEVVASHLLLVGHDRVGGYLSGATEEAFRRYAVYPLYVRDGVEEARSRGLPVFDLMWGRGEHKLQWSPQMIPSRRLILGRARLPLWAPYAAHHLLRSRVKAAADSGSAPRPVMAAAETYRSVRRFLRRRRVAG
ncbi:GNAT family N-acetyltransferase [Rubrobacter xylanophilus]|uniref:GNAT family N-acetyltransferase n=1 Tax=Rubrobacter xylanophilus TaxID=49319 RepID=UPI001F27CC92|nr:GNAT family N-acetyltransferase [Rubrobacter xylanophilus]